MLHSSKFSEDEKKVRVTSRRYKKEQEQDEGSNEKGKKRQKVVQLRAPGAVGRVPTVPNGPVTQSRRLRIQT